MYVATLSDFALMMAVLEPGLKILYIYFVSNFWSTIDHFETPNWCSG